MRKEDAPVAGDRRGSRYSLPPGYSMEAVYHVNLRERTGRSFEEWVAIARSSGPGGEKAKREWLKDEHGFTTNYAGWVASAAVGKEEGAEAYDPEALVAAMFEQKPALLPVYEKTLELALAIGADVKACPGKTIVPLYRKHVFGQLKPSTRTRLDLGLALKGVPAKELSRRLIDTGGAAKGDRITHRFAIGAERDLDEEVRRWLRIAYERDA
jgi:hypothetical protein